MAIPYAYTLKNLYARKLTTALTVAGLALVVYVFATALMLSAGLERTLVATGSPDNVIAIRAGSATEIQSAIERAPAAVVESLPDIATGADGGRLASKEVVVLVGLPKKGTGKPSNVAIRGVSETGLRLRPQVSLTKGRLFRPGSSEIIVGRRIAQSFAGAGLGERLHFGMRDWTIVGIFDAGATGFSSEIWGDAEQFMQAFRRNAYSSIIFKLADPTAFDRVAARIDNDPRLTLKTRRETRFYAAQSEKMANFLRTFGSVLSVIFSTGAIIGATITMYASVASRTAEIGALRALGFRRRSILGAFLGEALALGLLGGVAGALLASTMQFMTISTVNWQTFSELAFTFVMTPTILIQCLLFALSMGLVGGFLPAARAARIDIIDALRAA